MYVHKYIYDYEQPISDYDSDFEEDSTSRPRDPRPDRIKHLFREIITKCNKLSSNYRPKDVASIESSLRLAEDMFFEYSKKPVYSNTVAKDPWFELKSLHEEVLRVSNEFINNPVKVAKIPKTPKSSENITLGNSQLRAELKTKVTNVATLIEIESLIEKILAIPPLKGETPADMNVFLATSGDLVERLGRYSAKTYFPFYLVYRLLPMKLKLAWNELECIRRDGHPPGSADIVELRNYLESYLKLYHIRDKTSKNPSRVWENFFDMIEDLLQMPPVLYTTEELSEFLHTLDAVSKRLLKEEAQVPELNSLVTLHMILRLIPNSIVHAYLLTDKPTQPPHFHELRRFLIEHIYSAQSAPVSGNGSFARTPKESSRTISMPPSSVSTQNGCPPVIKRTEPSSNPLVIGSYCKNFRTEKRSIENDKHPVSLLSEFCTRRKFRQPEFNTVKEEGPPHQKRFIIKVTVNGVDYQPSITSSTKKIAKSEAARVCLRALGVLPKS